MRKTLLTAATAALALMTGYAAPSHAGLILKLSDGTPADTVTITDLGNTGEAQFNSPLGIFSTNATTAFGAPILGALNQPIIDLLSFDVANRSSSGGILTIAETFTGFSGSGAVAQFLNSIGGTLNNGSMTVNTYMDCGNTAFGQGTSLTSQSFGAGAFSGSASKEQSTCGGTYSLTQVETINLAAGGFYSGDSTLQVPEPSTLATFGAALVFLFGFGWLRRHGTMV